MQLFMHVQNYVRFGRGPKSAATVVHSNVGFIQTALNFGDLAIYELVVKIVTPVFDSLTLFPYSELYFCNLSTFAVDFFTR